MVIQVLAIVLALGLLMFFAYRGFRLLFLHQYSHCLR